MKDRSHNDLRRAGRPGRDRRVLRSNRSRLSNMPGQDGGVLHQPTHRKGTKNAVQKSRTSHNWVVKRDGDTVIAIEPNRSYENVFEGGADPFGEALKYAAAELKKELAGVNEH